MKFRYTFINNMLKYEQGYEQRLPRSLSQFNFLD